MVVKGQKINDRYEVIRLIGEGGMANVYLAHDTILDRDVAVKVLRGDLASDEKFIRRFQREAISASSLSHPNIVEIYDVGEDNGDYYIVMEYVPGRTLKSLIKKRGALTIPEVIDIMLQLTAGVATAHASYIIHRDLKPQNVLILDDGMVKITDFGIAVALNSKELTQTNSVMGSVHYLPPEQASGSGSTIRSDIYSLGIIMFELLTGKLPFKGENAVEIAIKQMKEPIPSVRSKNPDIPQSIENIILKACAKNPKNRYENVLEMRDDLESCMKEEHANDRRIEYKYPEQDLEATKIMPSLKDIEINSDTNKTQTSGKKTKSNLMAYIIAAIVIIVASFFVILALTTVPDVVVPDVSGKSIVDAESLLKSKGFTINPDNEEEESDTVDPGLVIKTNPVANVTRKKGTEITLVVSKKSDSVELDDYTGKNYYEIKANLEAKGIYVLIEKKTVDDATSAVADNIIAQNPAKGTKVTKGDTVTLYIADITDKYPDFVKEGWSVSDVKAFADKYSLSLEVDNEETTSSKDGTILNQSRAAGTKIIAKATLKITVAKAPATSSTSPDSSAKVN